MDDAYSLTFYQPLFGPRTTRLLYLYPAADGDPLEGHLECASLEAHPKYEALSYKWGSPEKTQSIKLKNGFTIDITQSLFDALIDLRPRPQARRPRIVWADGICINQEDIDERQQQVSIMSTIYQSAFRVITYIGPASESSSLAIEFAMYLLWTYSRNPNSLRDPRLHLPNEVHNIGLPPIHEPRWNALKTLLLRGWSSRCWCAHEFLMNKTLMLMCGRQEFTYWRFLSDIVQLVVNRELPIFLVPRDEEDPDCLRECLVSLSHLRNNIVESGASFSLMDLMVSSHPFKASDPRDKVYSLLGLANDREKYAISVDYTCSPASLYTAIAARYIAITPGSESIEVLYSNLTRKTIQLPSWVPDWSTWKYGSHGVSFWYHYAACGATSAFVKVDESGLKLHAAGCLVNMISWVDNVNITSFYGTLFEPGRRQWIEEMERVVQDLAPCSQDKNEVLWKTLVGDVTLDEAQATDAYMTNYQAHATITEESPRWEQNLAREFCDAARRRSRQRRLCAAEDGYFCAVPETTQHGDYICMLEGGRLLFTVRPVGDEFVFVGPAYVHNLMHGEVLEMDSYERRTITLI